MASDKGRVVRRGRSDKDTLLGVGMVLLSDTSSGCGPITINCM